MKTKLKSVSTLLFVVFILSLSACGPETKAERSTIDLIPLHIIARQHAETGAIELASPRYDYHFISGWSRPLTTDGDTIKIAAVKEVVKLRYSVLKPANRWLLFDFNLSGPLGSISEQTVEFIHNDKVLETQDIEDGKQVAVFIPEKKQTVGDNVITLRFSQFKPEEKLDPSAKISDAGYYPGIAGYLSNIAIELGSRKEVWTNELMYADNSFQQIAGGKAFAQRANSVQEYGFKFGKDSTLEFSADLLAPAYKHETVTVEIELEKENADPQSLWANDFVLENDQETSITLSGKIDLPVEKETICRLAVSVTSDSRPKDIRVIWKKLKLQTPNNEIPAKEHVVTKSEENKPKHVFILLFDAARADQFGAYGNEEGITPVSDAFAQQAVVFKQVASAAPYTVPSIASIMTGMLPERHGVRDRSDNLPAEIASLPETLKDNGYYNLYLNGNWVNTSIVGSTRHFDKDVKIWAEQDIESNLNRVDLETIKRELNEAEKTGKPLFVFMHLLPPHWPYHPPAPFDEFSGDLPADDPDYRAVMLVDLISRGWIDADHHWIQTHFRKYKNTLHYVDSIAGNILDYLKEKNLFEDSLVIITSDHGEAFGEHNWIGHNQTNFDEVIRVPWIMRLPGTTAQQVIKTPVGLVDMFPTIVDILGLKSDLSLLDGSSQRMLLEGNKPLNQTYYYSRGIGDLPQFALRGERFKFVQYLWDEYLFDLKKDPGELHNLRDKKPALAAYLGQIGRMTMATYQKIIDPSGKKKTLSEEDHDLLRDLGYLQ